MTLYDKIMTIYPQLEIEDFYSNIKLRNDGDGDYIEEWNHPTLTKPTQEQLDDIS